MSPTQFATTAISQAALKCRTVERKNMGFSTVCGKSRFTYPIAIAIASGK
jgi:hypothetical protein